MQRVLLINPPDTDQTGFSDPPLGLLYLAGTLLHHGIDVRVVDGCLDGRQAIAVALTDFQPDIVGITCLTAGRHRALEVARAIKDDHPNLPVVLGGVHPTILPMQLMEHYAFVDFVVMGEGEQTLLELAQERPLAEIKGLVYRQGEEIRRNPPRPLVANLDEISLPAWHLLDLQRYPARDTGIFRGIDLAKEPRVSVIFSRGCVGHCSFCSTWWVWRGWRHRSAINMVDEIELLYSQHGIRHFCFADDALTVDRQATLELCDEIVARRLDIAFFASTRADCVDETVLRKLKEAGCHHISFGVETASQSLLERMGKKTEVASARRAIRLSKEAGLRTTALVIVGNQGETEETIDETIAFLRETGPDDVGCVGGLWIFPGTGLYQNCKRQGYINDDFWLGPEPYKLFELEHTAGEIGEYFHRVVNFAQQEPEPATASLAPVLRQQPVASGSPRISLVVNTLNAAPHLGACLESAAGVVDEIVVVDMHSDDDTPDIARQHGARVLTYPHMGYVEPARNFAVDQATGDWILILDADERLTPAFRDALRSLVADPGGIQVFQVPYNTCIAGRWLQGTGWGRDREKHPRLFRKGAVRWGGAIHAAPQITGVEANLPLHPAAAIDHLNFANLHEFVERLNRYTGVEAASLADDGQAWTTRGMLRAARQEVVDRYEPAVDGVHSLVLSVTMAYYRFLTLAKLWERQGYPQDRLPASPQDLFAWLADPTTEMKWLEPAQEPAASARPAPGPAVVSPPSAAPSSLPGAHLNRTIYRDEGGWRPQEADGAGPADGLDFTGERLVPGKTDPLLELEHVTRYRYAAQLVGSGRVLDDGCGAGYGSAILAESGATVTGIDVNEAAIAHCRRRYPGPGLDFQTMDSARLTFPSEGFDAVVSFEVIEHVAAYQEYVREAWRVLRPGGLLIVSTPNKRTYTDATDHHNPYHVHEFYVDEFRQLLEGVFPSVQLLGQTYTQSLVIGLPSGDPAPSEACWPQVDGLVPPSPEGYLNRSQYLIAVCRKAGPAGSALPPLPNQVTVLATAAPPVSSATSDSPVGGEPSQSDAGIRFASGFYHDEGGRRWMSRQGILVVPAALLASPATLRFALTCGQAGNYDAFPFDVQVHAGNNQMRTVTFEHSEQTLVVALELAPGADVRIRLASSQTFEPYLSGVNFDRRILSVSLSGLALTSRTPADLSAWLSRAAAADAAGDPAGAETILRQSLRQHPNAPEPYRQLALLLASRQDYPQAGHMLVQALALAPADAALHNEHGTLSLLLGDLPGAVAAYQRALELDPALEAARANLAACQAYLPRGPQEG